jgi:Planctomycete cytochrome C
MKRTAILFMAGLTTTAWSVMAADPESPKLPPPSTQKDVTYAKNIRPIFEASCFQCHGEQRPRANLRLDSLEGVLKGSQDHKVIISGDSEKSPLVLAVARVNPRVVMPPPPRPPGRGRGGPGGAGTNAPSAGQSPAPVAAGTNQPAGGPQRGMGQGPAPAPLTPEQVGLIRAWVDQGAK